MIEAILATIMMIIMGALVYIVFIPMFFKESTVPQQYRSYCSISQLVGTSMAYYTLVKQTPSIASRINIEVIPTLQPYYVHISGIQDNANN